MAILDTDANEIVIRVVYDGPPEAGKTTSMRALAQSFDQTTVTPEEDATGRTQWFDWMEYVGGRFEGSRIRCQIVSVPGQRELRHRRHALLASADAVVFVGDSAPARWELSLSYLFELRRLVATDGPPIGVVFQANKRDAPGAIDLASLRARLGDARWSIGIVEAVAADGTGIREAFVYAVRLAIDRVRELVTRGALPRGTPEMTSPAQLLAQLRDHEQRALAAEAPLSVPLLPPIPPPPRVMSENHALAAELLREVFAVEDVKASPRTQDGAPAPPDATVPSGAIWPPVEGRAILLEVSDLSLVPRRTANGDWSAGLGSGWRIVSAREAVYENLDEGREALVAWARLHAACSIAVSPHRCIVLAANGDGQWRMWQIVRAELSLREHAEVAASESPDDAIHRICETAKLLVDVHQRLAEMPCELPCSLDTVGQCDESGMYIGLMPVSPPAPSAERLEANALLVAELGPVLELDLASMKPDLGQALERVPRQFAHAETVVASLARLLR